jgi:hypothetical protein
MKGEKAMATKREELIAWKKLKRTFSGRHCTLGFDFIQYSSEISKIDDIIEYQAYVGGPKKGVISDSFTTPMEAVDDLIKKVEDSQ